MKVTPEIAKKAVDEFYPKSAMQIGEIRDLDRSLQDALDFKFISRRRRQGRRRPVRHRLQAEITAGTSQAAGSTGEIDRNIAAA